HYEPTPLEPETGLTDAETTSPDECAVVRAAHRSGLTRASPHPRGRGMRGRNLLAGPDRPRGGAVAAGGAAELRVPAVIAQPSGQLRSLRHDLRRIPIAVDDVVMLFALGEVDGVAEPGRLVQVPGIAPEVLERRQRLAIALEMAEVHGVEAHQGGEQTHVRLGDGLAHEETRAAEPVLDGVQRGEQTVEGGFVGFLGSGESAAVDAVVDLRVDQP